MPLNIVLFEPEIHTNTGNIGRLSMASGSKLHLVKPFGFEITDARLKRAGLDYWNHLSPIIYESTEEFFQKNSEKKMVYLSKNGEKTYDSIDFIDELFLIFGKESSGLSEELIRANQDHLYSIPIYSEKVRSLNLANSVAIVVYEGIRQLNL